MRHYIHEVNVIIDGELSEIVRVGSAGDFNLNMIKDMAIKIARENHPNAKLAPVLLNQREVSIEEYRQIMGANPPWLNNIE
ncbi:hypothetical protein [Flavobacterium sp. AG291]|uniref:hypothetical protein n=1 Tax=Flavobacterium sp. AG291 TaxID=2184000 RepID=UPI000E0B2F68|nr:hypothetical protein [Flavobacterium sp. AG291]RDI13203.1 hypothetical protein DEU42_103113 [Flavobacterium sp. AG291]